jgi:3-oxoacyl-[acyl-carrier-protein] synthase II
VLSERIFITACGIVSAAGVGLEALANARHNGISGLRSISLPELPPLLAGRVDEAAVEAFDRRLNLRPMDRSSKWATLAARLAIRAAKFPEKPAALAELGLFLNLSAGPSWAESEFLTSFLGNDHQVAQLSAFPYIVPSSVAGNVCRALMLSGHNLTLNPGPAAGLFGLEPALAALRCGHAGALLCGAVDELSDRILADNFFAGQISAEHPPGEGAAVFMLETATHANARGAKPLAEICGLASVVTKNSLAAALEEVAAAALQQAGIDRDDIRAVCFSGVTELLPQPAWREKLVQTSAVTGALEGAQPLLDLAAALHSPDLAAGDFILSLAVTPHGLAGAGLVRKL